MSAGELSEHFSVSRPTMSAHFSVPRTSARDRRHLRFSLTLAAGLVGAALLLTLAREQGWIDDDTVVRAYNVIMGLGFAAYGNALPKLMHHLPPRSIQEATLAQAVARVASWAMTLGFLAWAGFWRSRRGTSPWSVRWPRWAPGGGDARLRGVEVRGGPCFQERLN